MMTVKQVKNATTTRAPEGCDLRVGDKVVFTNPAGVVFKGFRVIGFAPDVEVARPETACVYLDWECPWFPAQLKELKPAKK